MFRAEISQLADGPALKLEGRLVGEWAEQVKALVAKSLLPTNLIIDVTDVTYVDSLGEQVMTWLSSVGGVFVAKSIYAKGVCERLGLPIQSETAGSQGEQREKGGRKTSTRHLRAS